MEEPVISVIICTRNRAGLVAEALASLRALPDDPPHEVIVVDNNSTDATASMVQKLAKESSGRLAYRFEARQGLSIARNAGIEAARGQILAFTDDDVFVDPGWLSALWRVYQSQPDAVSVGGRVVPVLPERLPMWMGRLSHSLVSGFNLGDAIARVNFPNSLWGGNISFRRAVFDQIGGFKADLGRTGDLPLAGEDTEICWRVQRSGIGNVYYAPEAVIYHRLSSERLSRAQLRRYAYASGQSRALIETWNRNRSRTVAGVVWTATGLSRNLAGVLYHWFLRHPGPCLEHDLACCRRLGYLHGSLLRILGGRSGSCTVAGPCLI